MDDLGAKVGRILVREFVDCMADYDVNCDVVSADPEFNSSMFRLAEHLIEVIKKEGQIDG